MRLREALAARRGFRKKQSLYASVMLFCLVYVLSPPSVVLRLAILAAIGVTADLTLTYFAVGLIAPPLRAYFSGTKAQPTELEVVREVAAEAGVTLPGQAFSLSDGDTPAVTNGYTRKMVFSRRLVESLTRDELRFVGGHEVTHIQTRGRTMAELLGFGLGAAVSVDLGFGVMGLPRSLLILPAFAAMVLVTYWALRRAELRCDLGGALFAPEEAALSAMRKVYGAGMDEASDTHPSGNSRVKNLQKFYHRRPRP